MTEEEHSKHVEDINKMDRISMARLYRTAECGHPYFDSTYDLYDIFMKRFNELGGFNPTISKLIGFD